jgi:2-polyprenyl-3-methyl-5-hydroxy-6-metoxy-1,4-benzoquinol methylase
MAGELTAPLRIETEVEAETLREKLRSWAPWRVVIEFSNGVSTDEFAKEFPFSQSPLWKLGRFEGSVPFQTLRDILDVGCNVGYNAIYLARDHGARCVGIDVQQRLIDAAQYFAGLVDVDCQFELAHAESFIKPESFDLVIHFGTLYHLPNPLGGLRAAWENLRPGGWLCLETQTYDDPADERMCYWLHGLNDDLSNFFALSTTAVRESLELLGFRDVHEVHREATTVGSREHMYRVFLAAVKTAGPPLEQRWPSWAPL